ncbi:MAG: peptidase [Bacteroidales bacterium]|nr:peptidase [Bacteroidales bacterium]
MNSKRLVKLSNAIGVISIILLIYWIFIFISIQVFDLKVFREYITEAFFMSILGILAVMFGALMINIMFNLTRIADKHNADSTYNNKNTKKTLILVTLSFPLIFILLIGGDWYTAKVKEKSLIKAAETIIINNERAVNEIADYSFSKKWLLNTRRKLNYFSRIDRYFPSVSVLVLDTIDNHKVYLEYKSYFHFNDTDTILPEKFDFIKATTNEERSYLTEVFEQNDNKLRFSKHRGNYELFYPYTFKNRTVVFYFSDYQYYGKLAYGSYPERDEGIIMEPIEVETSENDSIIDFENQP